MNNETTTTTEEVQENPSSQENNTPLSVEVLGYDVGHFSQKLLNELDRLIQNHNLGEVTGTVLKSIVQNWAQQLQSQGIHTINIAGQ